MSGGTILFWILAAGAAFGAVAVVLTQNVVRMAFWLIVSLGSTAGLFFLLHADFVGASQLLVYVGGTVVLLIFGVMLTASGPYNQLKPSPGSMIPVAIVGIIVLFIMYMGLANVNWDRSVLRQVVLCRDFKSAHTTVDELMETTQEILDEADTLEDPENTSDVREGGEMLLELCLEFHAAKGQDAEERTKSLKVVAEKAGELLAHVDEADLEDEQLREQSALLERQVEALERTKELLGKFDSFKQKHFDQFDKDVQVFAFTPGPEFDGDKQKELLQQLKQEGLSFAPATKTGGTIRPLGFGLLGARPDKDLGIPEGLQKLSDGFYVVSAGSSKKMDSLSTGYLLPFEIVSVHLLVVLIGAAYLARAKRRVDADA